MITIKKIKYRIRNKIRYPGCSIHPQSNITGNTILGVGAEIGPSCTVISSLIGDYVTVHTGNYLQKVKCDRHVQLYNKGEFSEISIGAFTYIAPKAVISKTNVGSFCSIGPELICGYGDHPTDYPSTSPVFFSTGKQCGVTFATNDHYEERKEIKIGNDVWIGARVFIRDGVTIGDGAIVAAGSVVVKNVPDYAIVGGVPAKVIKFRFSEEIIVELQKLSWWNLPEDKLRSAQHTFAENDILAFLNCMRGIKAEITEK